MTDSIEARLNDVGKAQFTVEETLTVLVFDEGEYDSLSQKQRETKTSHEARDATIHGIPA